MISSFLTKLVNENRTEWDEHIDTILYVYHIAFKVTTRHTPFQLVYGLYLLMLMEYILPISNSHLDRNFFPISILTMAKLEHLDKTYHEAIDRVGTKQWNTLLWAQQNHKIKTFSMGT